jgi:hypothetical protein
MALLRVAPAALVSTESTRELAPVVDGVPQIASQARGRDGRFCRPVERPAGWGYADPEWREGVA